MVVLDMTFSADYQRLGEVTDKFMAALKKRKEVTNMFTFYAANYPQYELVINNDVAMQKGVTIKTAMDSLNILIGSTWEQGFIRFNFFYKVFVQAKPEFRRYPEDLDNLYVKNDKGEMVPYSAFMTIKRKQGLNEITRYNLYTSANIQCAPGCRLQHRSSHRGDQGGQCPDAAARLRHRLAWPRLRRSEKRQRGGLYLLYRRHLRLSRTGRAIRELYPAAGSDLVAAGRAFRFLLLPEGHGAG